jgi:hypothetical protein
MSKVQIQTECEGCGATLIFPASELGTVQECSNCGGYVDVPEITRYPTVFEMQSDAYGESIDTSKRQAERYEEQLNAGDRQIQHVDQQLDAFDSQLVRHKQLDDKKEQLLIRAEKMMDRWEAILDIVSKKISD